MRNQVLALVVEAIEKAPELRVFAARKPEAEDVFLQFLRVKVVQLIPDSRIHGFSILPSRLSHSGR